VAERRNEPTGAGLSIGALARATGLSIETLRTWERRYGFPLPERKASGHRVYPTSGVPRLRRIAAALAHGHRAGDVVRASDEELSALLGLLPAHAHAAVRADAAPAAPLDPEALLALVARFDGDGLTRALNAEWGRLGPMAFLEQRVAPLVRAVGDAWEAGTLEVRHEHFLSERLGDLLRTYRLPYEERARGPLGVLATLPGEQHGIGLQMAALAMAVAGCRVCYVGTEVPIPELASVVRDLGARIVGVSVSAATRGARTVAGLAKLRSLVVSHVTMLVGGDGAPRALAGATIVQSLSELVARVEAPGA
jgi:methylmalonyl-CoA mutase cobalamin-binding subunit